MTDLLATVLAALLGMLMDRLGAWVARQKAARDARDLAQLRRRGQIEQINARIDREVANEEDLDALLDRL